MDSPVQYVQYVLYVDMKRRKKKRRELRDEDTALVDYYAPRPLQNAD